MEARHAQLNHTVIPATQEFGWLSPGEGFAIAAVSLSFGLYAFIATFIRGRRQ
jgi:hypothetical protein